MPHQGAPTPNFRNVEWSEALDDCLQNIVNDFLFGAKHLIGKVTESSAV